MDERTHLREPEREPNLVLPSDFVDMLTHEIIASRRYKR
jgi:hypothetical protein